MRVYESFNSVYSSFHSVFIPVWLDVNPEIPKANRLSNIREMKTLALLLQTTNIKERLLQCKRQVNRPGSTHSPLVHHVTQPPFPPLGRFCHETRGFAVLIINSEFDSQSKRRSAVNDENYMYKMFEELNFDVHVLRNLSSKELEDKMKGISISVPIAIKTN